VDLSDEPLLEAHEIQGNGPRGFDSDFLHLVGLKLGTVATARTWLARLAERVDTLASVHSHRLSRSLAAAPTPGRVLLNVALSRVALDAFGFDSAAIGDGFFNLPMGKLAASLGDRVENGVPPDYVFGQDWARSPDVLLLLGSDDHALLEEASETFVGDAQGSGLTLLRIDRGGRLEGEREHFGYRDGISQVGIRGRLLGDHPLTLRLVAPDDPLAALFARPGQPLVWPGQFFFGYPTQGEDPLRPGPPSGGPPWMRNGSLLVYRRLRQDVAAFRAFVAASAAALSTAEHPLTPDQLGAMIVGRWQDGTPVQLSPGAPIPAVAADPLRVNHFSPAGVPPMRVVETGAPPSLRLTADADAGVRTIPGSDADLVGSRCPLFGHIRKVNPRGQRTDQGEAARTLMFQMLRRGIPYGPPFQPGAESDERGLLFLAYQTSFTQQFRLLNSQWMNNPSTPEKDGEGFDVLVGQDPSGGDRFGRLVDAEGTARAQVTTASRFVVATGGTFLFTPSRSFLASLALPPRS
jgi:Dyp-type peroxidase family